MKRAFKAKQKAFFISFKGFSFAKKCETLECAFKISNVTYMDSILAANPEERITEGS